MERKTAIVIEMANNGFVVKHLVEYKTADMDGVFVFGKYDDLAKWLHDHFSVVAKELKAGNL